MSDYEVAEYMVTSLDGARHPALLARPGSGIVFDGKKKRWVLEADGTDCTIPYDEIYRVAFLARDELLATANKYRKKMKQPMLNVDTSHDWMEVQESVQNACSGLEELAAKDKDMSGSLGKLKRAFRGLCRNAGAGQSAASLIPNDSFGFTSVLCGSLKVVFTGLRTTGIYRQEVYRTLEDLPTQLKDLAANIQMYDQDEQLHQRAAALYVASFHLLNHILLWFLKNTWMTGVKLLVDPLGFTDRLRDIQAELKMAAQSFEARLTKLSRETGRETVQLQYWTTYAQASIHTQLQTLIKGQKNMEERFARVEVLENLHPLLNNIIMEAIEQRAVTGGHPRLLKMAPDVNIEQLLERFLYQPDLVWNDSAALTKRLHRPRRAGYDAGRIAALQSNPRLRAWLTVDEPSLLLLNGRTHPRPDSEVSLFAAKIVQSLLQRYQAHNPEDEAGVTVIPLAFFCSQHRDWETDSNGSPDEVAMSLLMQLVNRARAYLDPAVLRQVSDRTKPGDIGSICSMFQALVHGLGPDVVVILVLDGLRDFARPPERCRGTRKLIAHLVEIYKQESMATLKFLFSSPSASEFVEDLFADDEFLDMPRDIPARFTRSPTASRAVANVESGELFDVGS